jgi:type IV secretory pathway VirJ component
VSPRSTIVSVAVAVGLGLVGGTRAASAQETSIREDTVRFGRFGDIALYRQRDRPSHVVLFVSGDGGWNLGVVGMAREVAGMDAAVAGIDIRRYKAALERAPEACGYPAADFEALGQWLERRLGYPMYVAPILAGYSSGATLVYATLVQAPPNTFRGAMSLGFCPELALHRPLCQEHALRWVRQRGTGRGPTADRVAFLPVDSTPAPWVVFQGEADSTCFADSAAAFVRHIRGAELVRLPKVGHGFGVRSRWIPQFRDALAHLTAAPTAVPAVTAAPVRDLPLIELRPKTGGHRLAVIVSGDGGWASLDRQIGETFAARGIPVVGLDALRYFWKARSPEQMGADFTRIVRHYLDAWHASDLLLVGYSRGAETLPFMINRLPGDLRARIRVVALIAPARVTAFEFHLRDWLGRTAGKVPTPDEIARLSGLDVLCLYGADERDSACPLLPPGVATLEELRGGHHFGGAYRELADRILRVAGD